MLASRRLTPILCTDEVKYRAIQRFRHSSVSQSVQFCETNRSSKRFSRSSPIDNRLKDRKTRKGKEGIDEKKKRRKKISLETVRADLRSPSPSNESQQCRTIDTRLVKQFHDSRGRKLIIVHNEAWWKNNGLVKSVRSSTCHRLVNAEMIWRRAREEEAGEEEARHAE